MFGRVRLWSGLVLFTYATLHLLNHTLLLGPLRLANDALVLAASIWQSLPGTVLL